MIEESNQVEEILMSVPSQMQEVYKRSTCIYNRQQVETAFDEMARVMHDKLAGTNPLLLSVMVGGMIPLGHLLPRLDFLLEVSYIHATRYDSGISGGEITWKAESSIDVSNRTVVIVDDILDGGITMQAIVDHLKDLKAKVVYTAVLVDKQQARVPGGLPQADFKGLDVENRYLFGYGMDYKEYFRNAPGIYKVAPEDE